MEIKFARGMATADSRRDLCSQCRHAQIVRGRSETEVRRQCTYAYNRPVEMPFRVAECSQFYPTTLPSLAEMKDVAWLLASDTVSKKIGFLKPGEWNKDVPPYR